MSFATVLVWLSRVVVAGVFLLAASGKINHPVKFAEEIQAYGMAPFSLTHVMAFTLPWVELVCAALLLVGFWRPQARLLIFIMLAVFTVAKIMAEVNQLKIDCGCFGGILGSIEKSLQGWNGIALNFVLLALCVLDGWLSDWRQRPPAGAAASAAEPAFNR